MFLGSGTSSSDMLRLAFSKVGNKKGSIVLKKGLFDLSLRRFVFIFLMISNKSSAESDSDSVDLRDITSSGDSDSDVNIGKGLLS